MVRADKCGKNNEEYEGYEIEEKYELLRPMLLRKLLADYCILMKIEVLKGGKCNQNGNDGEQSIGQETNGQQ